MEEEYAVFLISQGKKALNSSRGRVKDFGWLDVLGVPKVRCACYRTASLPLEGFSSWGPKA